MERAERVAAALLLEEPDAVPLAEEFVNADTAAASVGEWVRSCDELRRRLALAEWWGNDLVTVGGNVPDLVSEVVERGDGYVVVRRAYGSLELIRVRPSFSKVISVPVRRPEDVESLELPTLDDLEPHVEAVAREVEFFKSRGYFVEVFHNGPFVTTWYYLRGMEGLLVDVVRRPWLVRRLVGLAMGVQLEFTEALLDEAEVDAVRIGGDLGTKNTMFMSPEAYRELFSPWLSRLVAAYRRKGAFVLRHCHGNINPILGDIVREGFDCLDPLDPHDGIDLRLVKERYGDRMALRGGISSHIGLMSEEELREHVLDRLRVGAPGGGYVLMSAGGVPPEMSKSRVLYYRRLLRKLRRYPERA